MTDAGGGNVMTATEKEKKRGWQFEREYNRRTKWMLDKRVCIWRTEGDRRIQRGIFGEQNEIGGFIG